MHRAILGLFVGLGVMAGQAVAQPTADRADPPKTTEVAVVTDYGLGCRGSSGLSPHLWVKNLPYIGSQNFQYVVKPVCPCAPVRIFYSLARADLPVGNCSILIDPTRYVGDFGAMSDGTGVATLLQPIPYVKELVGAELFVQAAVLDYKGEFLHLGALSNGLYLQFGAL